jgi:hypothetical protein
MAQIGKRYRPAAPLRGLFMTIRNIWDSLTAKLRRLALATIGLGPAHRARSLHARLQDLERVSGRATLAIVAGIGIELCALFYLKGEWDSERIASIVADMLIFFGVVQLRLIR